MKKHLFFAAIFSAILLNSCSNKSAEYLSMGEQAYTSDNYELALLNWEKVMLSSGNSGKVDPMVYAKAGDAALKLDKISKAKEYLTIAYNKGLQGPEVLKNLSLVYKKSDNLSYEITYLEQLVKENAESAEISAYNAMLFDAYVRSENWQKAAALWDGLSPDNKNDKNTLNNWLIVQKALKNDDACFDISQQLLKLDPNHRDALEIHANHYYHKAEALYQREMSAYNSKKTRSQYAKLLKALKLATADFKVARDQFETLYKDTGDKKYAVYLSNIYTRLSNKQKAEYYKQLSK